VHATAGPRQSTVRFQPFLVVVHVVVIRERSFPLSSASGPPPIVVGGQGSQAEPALPWSGRFHDPAPGANLEEGRAWLSLDEGPVREGAIKITRAGSGPAPA
jgi:hypothetical protein